MNWEAVGALAELAGAMGVIFSLVYVGIQLKQNTKAMRSTAHREVSRIFADHNWDQARDYDLTALLLSQLNSEEIEDPVRVAQSVFHQRAYLMRMELLHDEAKLGVGSRERWEAMRDFTRAYLEDPKMRELWETDRPIYGSDFVNAINNATPDWASVNAVRTAVLR
ncbi:MAG: hypothetical protein ACI9ON_003065 [Limisphaerales bacterium]|jgi:hypothetical protein